VDELPQQNESVEVANLPPRTAAQTATKQVIFSASHRYQNQVNPRFHSAIRLSVTQLLGITVNPYTRSQKVLLACKSSCDSIAMSKQIPWSRMALASVTQ
jgi:hypothetical protein